MKHNICRIIAAAISVLVAGGCAHTAGEGYAGVKNSSGMTPQPGKALVLIYRTPGMAGMVMKPFVWANTSKMPERLPRGGFFSYDAAPGPLQVQFAWEDHRFSAAEEVATFVGSGVVGVAISPTLWKKRETNLVVEAGQTYYIEMDGRRLIERPRAKAEKQMAKCRWLNPR